MLKKLHYSVTFPTGRTLSVAVLFQGGFGAITGPNESGKSMIVEMIRYCLFGSAALRGKGDDYKTLKASLEFTMRGLDYSITRSNGKARISSQGQVLAVGTKPVNLKVIQIMGFNLDVFDMSCVANQDKLTELGDMQPTERRRRVDSVIGVAILDDLAKSAGDEALSHKRSADELTATAREPIAPKVPEGYRPSADLLAELLELEKLRAEADQLRGWLAIEKKQPVRPEDKVGMDSEVLQELLDAQTERKVQRQVLENELKRIPAASDVIEDELAADEAQHQLAQAYRARRQFLTHYTMPDFSQDQIDGLRAVWKTYNNWLKLEHLKKQRADLLAKGEHTCPSCTHHWPIAGEAVSPLDIEISAFSKTLLVEDKPATSEADIDKHQRILDAWDEAEWAKHEDAPERAPATRWTLEQIAQFRVGIANQARRAELVAQLEQMKPADKEPDYAGMLRERQQYEMLLGMWADQVEGYEVWQKERQQKMIQLAMLDVDLQGHAMLSHTLDQARNYEQYVKIYEQQLEAYNKTVGQIAAYRADADDWKKVKDALVILRSKIKQYLVPSLNRVASSFIHHMTGGDRQVISVDEDFNITVDGQEINTLSGSGKAVANLALRIGLGQVLTNNVLSLFMGDEIDASMDKNRAEKTSMVLHTLKERISQILLVSHKFPAADYYIGLGESLHINDDYQIAS